VTVRTTEQRPRRKNTTRPIPETRPTRKGDIATVDFTPTGNPPCTVTNRSRPDHSRRDNCHPTGAGRRSGFHAPLMGRAVLTPPHPDQRALMDPTGRQDAAVRRVRPQDMFPTIRSDSSTVRRSRFRRVTGFLHAAREQYPDGHYPYPGARTTDHSVLTIPRLSRYLIGADHHSCPGTVASPPIAPRPGRSTCQVQAFHGQFFLRPRWARTRR
jgi:hypothetical protein